MRGATTVVLRCYNVALGAWSEEPGTKPPDPRGEGRKHGGGQVRPGPYTKNVRFLG